jgi:transposase
MLEKMGHVVRLIPAREVKPFVRLPKTDASDAAAIAEAARRLELRHVPVKTETCQATCSAHRARDQWMRRRTSLSNALRAHLAEFGIGPLTASVLVAFTGDARRFRSARRFGAWLGLAPRVEASGGRTRIGGITRAGPSTCAGS